MYYSVFIQKLKEDFHMSYGNQKRLSNKLPVVKSNPLVEAKFKTTALEYKILMTAASKIKSTDTVLEDIEFGVNEFCKLMHVQEDNSGMHDYLKRACKKLVGKPVSINNSAMKEMFPEETDDEGWTIFPWLHHIKYTKQNKTIKLRFHEYMKPLLLYMLDNQGYTKYLLENINKCESIYSMRIYELCKQYLVIGERTFELSELREVLGLKEKEYKLYADFKKRILQIAYEEINKKTDIGIDFEEIKNGKRVVKIKFKVKSKNKLMDDDFKSLDGLPKEQLSKLLQLEIQKRYVVVMPFEKINKHSDNAILVLLKDLKSGKYDKTPISKPTGFFIWQLDELDGEHDEE
jgi:plasmid replication initiation protein